MSKIKDEIPKPHCSIPSTNKNGTFTEDVAPFERWLDKKLKTAYGSVLEEPIPQDIINLLRKKLDEQSS